MQPIDKQELEKIRDAAKASGKDTSEIEMILKEEKFKEPIMGQIKTKDVRKDVWMRTAVGSEKKKTEGKVVIMSTGPAREDDFE